MEEPSGALPRKDRSLNSSCSFRALETVSSLAKKKLPSHRHNPSQPDASHMKRMITVPNTPVLASYAGSLDAAAWSHATRGHGTIRASPVRLHSAQPALRLLLAVCATSHQGGCLPVVKSVSSCPAYSGLPVILLCTECCVCRPPLLPCWPST